MSIAFYFSFMMYYLIPGWNYFSVYSPLGGTFLWFGPLETKDKRRMDGLLYSLIVTGQMCWDTQSISLLKLHFMFSKINDKKEICRKRQVELSCGALPYGSILTTDCGA